MNWSLTIGRIAGTNIRLNVTFLIFLIWIGTADYLAGGPSAAVESIVFILLVFLCVTLHEFGHIAMARRFGVNTPEVILSPIGGIAAMARMPDKPRQELLVAIADVSHYVVQGTALDAEARNRGTSVYFSNSRDRGSNPCCDWKGTLASTRPAAGHLPLTAYARESAKALTVPISPGRTGFVGTTMASKSGST